MYLIPFHIYRCDGSGVFFLCFAVPTKSTIFLTLSQHMRLVPLSTVLEHPGVALLESYSLHIPGCAHCNPEVHGVQNEHSSKDLNIRVANKHGASESTQQ